MPLSCKGDGSVSDHTCVCRELIGMFLHWSPTTCRGVCYRLITTCHAMYQVEWRVQCTKRLICLQTAPEVWHSGSHAGVPCFPTAKGMHLCRNASQDSRAYKERVCHLQLCIDLSPVQQHILHDHIIDQVWLLQGCILLRLQSRQKCSSSAHLTKQVVHSITVCKVAYRATAFVKHPILPQ